MRRRSTAIANHDISPVRFAWWASFFATLALIAILGMARSAQALTLPGPSGFGPAAALVPPPDDEEGDEGEAAASEDEEFEVEACDDEEECEEEDDEGGPEAPEECLLSSADATVSASPAHDKVRLVVQYTTFSPTTVSVDSWLRGSKGPLALDGETKRFGPSGVFRQTVSLSEAQMTKVMAARDFTVQLHPADAPRYCQRLFDRHLTLRRAAAGGLTWSDPESTLRPGRR